MRKIIFYLLVSCLLISCGKKENEVIKIGAILPLTGPAASFGEASKNAITLANNSLEEKERFELIFEDGQADPKSSISAFNKMYELENIRYYITMTSRVSMALKPIVNSKKILLFANASHPDITLNSKNILRFSNTAEDEALTIVKFLNSENYDGSIGIIAMNDDYGRSYVTQIEQILLNLNKNSNINVEYFSNEKNDFKPIIVSLERNHPQIIIIIGFGTQVGICIRQIRELGITTPFIVSLGFILSNDAITSAGNSVQNGYYINFGFTSDKNTLSFYNSYLKNYGIEPAPNAYIDYLCIKLLDRFRNENLLNPVSMNQIVGRDFELENRIYSIDSFGNIKIPVEVHKFPKNDNPTLWRLPSEE